MSEHDVLVFWIFMIFMCILLYYEMHSDKMIRVVVHHGCSWCIISTPNGTEVIVGHLRTKVGTVWISSLVAGRAWMKQTEINMSKRGYKLSHV